MVVEGEDCRCGLKELSEINFDFMKIQLYKVYPGITEKQLKPIKIEINGKLATLFERGSDDIPWPTTKIFSCEKDNTFQKEFKKLPLNYKFTFYPRHEDDDDLLASLEGYAHLNYINRKKIDWLFNRHWLQKSENIKWLISIPLSIITALATTWLANYFHIFE